MPFRKRIYFLLILALGPCHLMNAYSQVITLESIGDHYRILKDSVPVNDTLYTEISEMVDGVFWVNKGDLYGFIDSTGREITEYIYDEVSSFHDGKARVARDSMYGYIDRSGRESIGIKYQEATLFKLGLASVRLGSQWFLIDTANTRKFELPIDHPAAYITHDFICVSVNKKWGVIDKNGRIIHPFEYDLICPDGKAYKKDHLVYLNRL